MGYGDGGLAWRWGVLCDGGIAREMEMRLEVHGVGKMMGRVVATG
jgi:hypothetical protein